MECKKKDSRGAKKKDQEKLEEIFDAYGKLALDSNRIQTYLEENDSLGGRELEGPSSEAFKRKLEANKKFLMKKYNFNELGRFKGGVPNQFHTFRGSAIGETGSFHDIGHLRFKEGKDDATDFTVSRLDSVEYGRYMKDDQVIMEMKKTYIEGKIDDNYFNITELKFWWKFIQIAVIFKLVNGIYVVLKKKWARKYWEVLQIK